MQFEIFLSKMSSLEGSILQTILNKMPPFIAYYVNKTLNNSFFTCLLPKFS